jgi:hypothetical protein
VHFNQLLFLYINVSSNLKILRLKNISNQDDLTGKRPTMPNFFGKWLDSNNYADTPFKWHRKLTERTIQGRDELLERLSDDIIKNHYTAVI